MVRNISLYSIARATGLCALRHMLKSWVWSPLVGTARLYIGAQHGIMPAALGYCGIQTILLSCLFHAGIIWYTCTDWIGLIRNLPCATILASIYITCMHHVPRWQRMLIASSIAMVGWTCFYMHPIGNSAMTYTIYWIIPIICSIYAHRSIWVTMLGGTFTAHLTGSCIWLFTTHLTAAEWHSLIPLVALERFTCACMMTGTYYVCQHSTAWYHTLRSYARAIGKQIYALI